MLLCGGNAALGGKVEGMVVGVEHDSLLCMQVGGLPYLSASELLHASVKSLGRWGLLVRGRKLHWLKPRRAKKKAFQALESPIPAWFRTAAECRRQCELHLIPPNVAPYRSPRRCSGRPRGHRQEGRFRVQRGRRVRDARNIRHLPKTHRAHARERAHRAAEEAGAACGASAGPVGQAGKLPR